MPLVVESVVLLTVTHFVDYLNSLVGTAAQPKQDALRAYLVKHGREAERKHALACDVPTLAKIAKSHLSFQERGSRIEHLFQATFGCSPWPSDPIKNNHIR